MGEKIEIERDREREREEREKRERREEKRKDVTYFCVCITYASSKYLCLHYILSLFHDVGVLKVCT